MKEFTIYDNYYNEDSYNLAIENILDNVFLTEESITITDNYGITVEVNREQYRQTITEQAIWEELNTMNSIELDDTRSMLSYCDTNRNGIIAIADIGMWNGRRQGYKEYNHLQDILYSNDDSIKLYLNSNYDLIKSTSHHDGNNRILYRYWKDNITDTQKENFLAKIYQGKVTKKDISRYTRKIGMEIASYYGV